MNHLNKIFVFIFCLLFVLIIIEVTYYFSSANIQPAQTKPVESSSLISPSSIAPGTNGALDITTLNMMAGLKKGTVTSSVLNVKLNGTIVAFPTPMSTTYKIKFTLMGDNQETNNLNFSDERLIKTKVYELVNEKEVAYDINQLKIGDKISVEMTFDLAKKLENSLILAKITKI